MLYCSASLSRTDKWQYSSHRVSNVISSHWSDDLTDNFTVYHSRPGCSHILYTTDTDGDFFQPGFKIRLWFWWWMCFSKSQIVAVLKCMIYISQPSWYFFTHFSWKIPGYLSPLSELLTPLDSASWGDWGTQQRFETKHLTWLQSCHCSARSPQSENNWHGKMPPATGSC